MNVKSFIKKWLIPRGYIEMYKKSITSKQFLPEKLLPENENLRSKYKDVKRCFILATGPSIKNENLDLLQNEFCISVSNFFVHEKYLSLKPKFHVFAPSHPPITSEQYSAWLKDASDNTHFETTFVVADSNRSIVESTLIHSNKLFYLSGGDFPVDFCKRLPPVQTVVHVAIYLAIYLGIKEIYLLGADHSWVLHYGKSNHFYEENKHKLVQQNYSEWIEDDIGKEFENNAVLWDFYRKIRSYSKENNYKIVNLTKESLLDVFERDTLENILKN